MSKITDLPLELLLIIFKDIGFLNLLRLRSTCKLWRDIIDNNAIAEELVILNEDDWYETSYYYTVDKFKDKIINIKQMRLKEDELFENLINLKVLNNLKDLVIEHSNYLTITNFISNFSKLKYLTFELVGQNGLKNKSKIIYYLSNSKLEKVNAVFNQQSIDYEFEINCPNLICLIIDGEISRLKIDDINKIKYLSVKYEADEPKNINPVNLDKFIQLKLFHLNWDNNFLFRTLKEGTHIALKLGLSNLFDYKQNSRREFLIYLNRMKLEDKDHAKKVVDEIEEKHAEEDRYFNDYDYYDSDRDSY